MIRHRSLLSLLPLLLLLLLMAVGRGMDTDEVHFIPKVTTTSTTPSTPSSKHPSVLTSLDIPPEYLEEILRPRKPPKIPREPSLHRQPQQEAPAGQHTPQEHEGQYTGEEEHEKSHEYKNTPLHNAVGSQSPGRGEESLEIRAESSQIPAIVFSSSKDSGSGENDQQKSRWRWGWWNEEPSEVQQRREESNSGPRFDRTLARKLTVQEGKTAVLACRVVNNDEKAVSWMRHQDLHILSVGEYKYNSDDRITVSLNEERQEWRLVIERVTLKDAGMYQCQVATKPVLSFVVNLEVVVPKAEVLNGPEVFVHCGSLINLTCVVLHGTRRPVYVYWYHHDKVLDYEGRGGVTVITQASENTISHLLMRNATPSDSGTYSCTPSNGRRATTTVHVLNGEHRAAMQSATGPHCLAPLLLVLCLASVLPLYISPAAP
ncbi:hypothetical protein O3P69_009084 [Scylla paramamosain]|uniref:Ig-like domain-containing protein n=1 Tax=Scylla paramamosain TaxID=85552 RepID=A0AAW0TQR0_SCYPA